MEHLRLGTRMLLVLGCSGEVDTPNDIEAAVDADAQWVRVDLSLSTNHLREQPRRKLELQAPEEAQAFGFTSMNSTPKKDRISLSWGNIFTTAPWQLHHRCGTGQPRARSVFNRRERQSLRLRY